MAIRLNEPLSRRRAAQVVLIIAATTALLWGGWQLYLRKANRPASTASVKRSIWNYLGKQTSQKDFTGPLQGLPVDSITNQTIAITITNKAGRVRLVERPVKAGRLGLPETSLSSYFRTNHAEAATYAEMYRLIGVQLTLAEQLLGSDERLRQLGGLVMAGEASVHARQQAENPWLAARICEAYLWPHLSLVEGTNNASFTPDALLNLCDLAFKEAGETNHIIRNYELLISKSSRPPQADNARFRLARIYEDLGEDAKALALLRQIKTIRTPRLERQMASLEERLKKKQ